ncbi:MAG: hypothetical protein IT179_03695 [Acidobacteria bacterium]|nr:hypothetical protein [Acidobacteriota bacterium]
MAGEKATTDLADQLSALEERLMERFDALQRQAEALERRVDHRLTELRAKQEEDLMLVKALSCQVRGRVERVERRGARGG